MSQACAACGYDPGFEAVVCPRCGVPASGGARRGAGNAEATLFDRISSLAAGDPAGHGALFVRKGPDIGRQFMLRGTNRIGREAVCEIALKDGRVSREHARIKLIDGRFVYQDLQAANGSYLIANGREERLRDAHVLCDGDEIMVGGTILRFISYDPGAQR